MPIYMQYDGIPGDVSAQGFEKTIELNSYSFAEANSPTTGGGGAGKVSFTDLSLTKRSGKGSADLFKNCATGKHSPKVVISNVRNMGARARVIQRITLSDVLITSFQVDADQASIPHETLSLNFTKIKFEVSVQQPDGTFVFESAEYDIKNGK